MIFAPCSLTSDKRQLDPQRRPCDDVTTGAGNDLERATEMAHSMVCEWGMSDAMGPLTFGKKEEQIFLGREIAQRSDYSEDTALRIDQEVRRIVTESYQRALRVLQEHRSGLQGLATALLSREVLDADQVHRILAGQSLDEPPPSTPQPPPSVVDDRTRKEARPGFVPPLGSPLPQE